MMIINGMKVVGCYEVGWCVFLIDLGGYKDGRKRVWNGNVCWCLFKEFGFEGVWILGR